MTETKKKRARRSPRAPEEIVAQKARSMSPSSLTRFARSLVETDSETARYLAEALGRALNDEGMSISAPKGPRPSTPSAGDAPSQS